MTITHKINDFLIELFPEADGDREKLIDAIKKIHTEGPFEQEVLAEKVLNWVTLKMSQ